MSHSQSHLFQKRQNRGHIIHSPSPVIDNANGKAQTCLDNKPPNFKRDQNFKTEIDTNRETYKEAPLVKRDS